MVVFTNSEFEIEDIEDYCVITYKVPFGGDKVSLETAKIAVKERKRRTKKRKFLYAVNDGVSFSYESIKYFSQDVSIEGIDSASIYIESNSFLNKVVVITFIFAFNIFLLFKYNPKMKFFYKYKGAVKWIKKQ